MPEAEAAIRGQHVKHDDWWCEAGERIRDGQDECDTRQALAALDAARAENARLRAALEDIDHWLIHPARSYTPHELAMEAHRQVLAALKGT